jgi:hypothetical protein
MSDKKKYYGLDDIGIIGKQEKKSSASYRYHFRKTAEVFSRFKQNDSSIKTSRTQNTFIKKTA